MDNERPTVAASSAAKLQEVKLHELDVRLDKEGRVAFERAADEYFKTIDSRGILLCDDRVSLNEAEREQVRQTLQKAVENLQTWMGEKKL